MAERVVLTPLNQNADFRRCTICSQLDDRQRASQKVWDEELENTHLPAAASLLTAVGTVRGVSAELRQCPECTTCYLYRWAYEFLIGGEGSEDRQELTRLTAAETAGWLNDLVPPRWTSSVATSSPAQSVDSPEAADEEDPREEAVITAKVVPATLGITSESISVDRSDPNFISVLYVQVQDGLDMGGRLMLERKSLPLIVAMLAQNLNADGSPPIEFQCGYDSFRIYESGSDQQPIINVLNRRPEAVPHSGLTGLMMTTQAAKFLLDLLRAQR